ncbi:MAG: putative toxin-antitoxin system toxin component, PIN family [Firmicutes bacterium]|nr:putative toxin-antitoxin system toxin component, PIN family [Bacillota bacterium]
MKIVLDTNVLVSGLLKPYSTSGLIVRQVAEGTIRIVYDSRILVEYREVLKREKFDFDTELVDILLNQIETEGLLVSGKPIKNKLPDPNDGPFLEVAHAMERIIIVTGNKKHFPEEVCAKITVMEPTQFIDYLSEQL